MLGGFDVIIHAGGLRIDINDWNCSFFGLASLHVHGFLDTSNGTFSFTASAGIEIGDHTFGVSGSASVTFSNSGFSGSVTGTVYAFGISVLSLTATIDV